MAGIWGTATDTASAIGGGLSAAPQTLWRGARTAAGKAADALGLGGGDFTDEQRAYQRDLQAERAAYGGGQNQAALRAGQLSWMDELLRRAKGEGPSVAQLQLQQGLDQALKNQMAMAAGARGPNVGLAQRNASIAGANLSADANAQAAQLRAAEMLQAGNAYGTAQNTTRQQDIDYANALRQNLLNSLNLGVEAQKAQYGLYGALAGAGGAVLAGLAK